MRTLFAMMLFCSSAQLLNASHVIRSVHTGTRYWANDGYHYFEESDNHGVFRKVPADTRPSWSALRRYPRVVLRPCPGPNCPTPQPGPSPQPWPDPPEPDEPEPIDPHVPPLPDIFPDDPKPQPDVDQSSDVPDYPQVTVLVDELGLFEDAQTLQFRSMAERARDKEGLPRGTKLRLMSIQRPEARAFPVGPADTPCIIVSDRGKIITMISGTGARTLGGDSATSDVDVEVAVSDTESRLSKIELAMAELKAVLSELPFDSKAGAPGPPGPAGPPGKDGLSESQVKAIIEEWAKDACNPVIVIRHGDKDSGEIKSTQPVPFGGTVTFWGFASER